MYRKLYSYLNGDYKVSIYSDGTKIRNGTGKPSIPESIDLKITNWCDGNCAWCHEQSSESGTHANLHPYVELLSQLPSGIEIAIGGGDALSHPEFEWFVRSLSSRGIICNVTVNEKHFIKHYNILRSLVNDNCLHGIGYSYFSIPCPFEYENLVTHIIIGITHPSRLEEITKLNKKILLLGYKDFGRGKNFKECNEEKVTKNIDAWYRYLFDVVNIAHTSFDNLAIDQLKPDRIMTKEKYDEFYMGDDGSFTMYIDAVNNKYGVNSTSEERYDVTNNIREMFQNLQH